MPSSKVFAPSLNVNVLSERSFRLSVIEVFPSERAVAPSFISEAPSAASSMPFPTAPSWSNIVSAYSFVTLAETSFSIFVSADSLIFDAI